MFKPIVVVVCLAAICSGLTAFVNSSASDPVSKEPIVVHAVYSYETCCAKCGRLDGEEGVAHHYCRHCGYSFKLLHRADPY